MKSFPWLLFLLIMWLVLTLCGCKPSQPIVQRQVHFTSLQQQGINWDSTSSAINSKISITIRDSVTIMVDSTGREISRSHYREKETDREYREQYLRLLAQYEQLLSAKADTTFITIEKQLSRWQQVCVDYGGEAIVALIALTLLFIIRIIK